MGRPAIKRIVLEVDEIDFNDIQREISMRQVGRYGLADDHGNLAGRHVAEMVRDIWDYRAMFDKKKRRGR